MTVARPVGGQFPASGREGRVVGSAAARSRLPACVVALIAAVGVLVVAAAFTAGRLGYASSPWAHGAYWLGQVLIVVPVAARLLSRRNLGAGEAVTLVVVLTVAEYLVKVCYSPDGFTFGDELARRLSPWHAAAFGAAVVIAACGVALAGVGAAVQSQPLFTQLWLSTRGVSAGTIKIGVTNDEGHPTGYRLVLLLNGHAKTAWNVTLANGDTWQRTVPFNGKTSLTANLYKLPDLTAPYRYVDTNGDGAPAS